MKNAFLPSLTAVAFAAGFFATAARATDVSELADTFSKRVDASLQAYKDQSAKIADEKIVMVREISRLEEENVALRARVSNAQKVTSDSNASLETLKGRLEALKSQNDFAQRYLREYLDTFEGRIQTAEDQHYKEALTKIRLTLEQPAENLGQRLEKQLAAVELGLKRAETMIGGYQFDGASITPDGVLKSGTIFAFGPSAIFSDAKRGGNTSGMLRAHPGTVEPALVVLASGYTQNIASFIEKKSGPVPLDASLGNAVALQSTNVKVSEHVRSGGPVGYAIILLGVIAAVLSVVKVFDLRRIHSVSPATLHAIIREARAHNEPAALALARKVAGPVGEMLEVGVRNLGTNLTLLEDMMLGVMLRRRPEVERFLSFLAVTAVASPLMGLLGTVAGMIRTFSLIVVFGTGDPRTLSSGISEALVTTELGLLVAIPAVAIHGILARMVKSRLGDMERVAFEFVKTVSLEETATQPAPR